MSFFPPVFPGASRRVFVDRVTALGADTQSLYISTPSQQRARLLSCSADAAPPGLHPRS
jgi:hypothetical protein